MSRKLAAGTAIVAALTSAVAGYRIGAGAWPSPLASLELKAAVPVAGRLHEPSERKVLYWKDPDGQNDFAPAPKETKDGRAYVPVYEDEETGFKGIAQPKPKTDRKIVYYRNPMGLADTSPVPKKDWMGMDYIPVYEGEEQDASTVKVSLDRVQRAGVRTEEARLRMLAQPVRSPAIAKPDERTLRTITLRADSFIEKLYVNETGRQVKAGEPLFRIYSPQMVSVQVDYRIAVTAPGKGPRDEAGALQRLRNLDVPESVLQQLRTSPNPSMSIDWPAPVSGVVLQKKAVEGQMVKAGEELLRLADLTSIWVIADVAEQDIGAIKIGAPAKVTFRAFPAEIFEGKVTFILHELETATRTGKVRIEVGNPDHRIKHEMFADVVIDAGAQDGERLAVPNSAVIDSGNRQVVIVDRGEGRFEPRAVKLGTRGDGFIEIREGLKAGENVVVAANFLIDAESNLKAALQAFTAEPAPKGEVKP
ncbi:MAG: efflux RND transporter periplasmic adaptor subunit [Hyphomicrobiaceae bacterium]|nr:MAG: efflux RND transporter periplasmic adaptor subunit [Hyphomicrobiaceae bacterium]